MDILGIDLRRNCWALAHTVKTPLNFRVAGYRLLKGDGFEELLSQLKAYIAERKIKDPKISVSLSSEHYASRLIKIPSPGPDSVPGALRFELEKHLPFGEECAYYSFQILKREKNIYTVLLATARKNRIDELSEWFETAGLKISSVTTRQAALFNALTRLKKIPSGKKLVIISMRKGGFILDIFKGSLPLYSKQATLNAAVSDGLSRAVKMEIMLSLPSLGAPEDRKLDGCFILSGESMDKEFLSDIKKDLFSEPPAALMEEGMSYAAFGASLNMAGRSCLNLNLMPDRQLKAHGANYANLALSGGVAFLLASTGSSYLARDYLTIKMLEVSIDESRARKAEVERMLDELKSTDNRIEALRGIKKASGCGGLELFKELSIILPDDSWLTGLECGDGGVSMEGLSGSASLMLLKMRESSMIKGLEFTGPVTKDAGGKERFRVKFNLSA